MIVVHTFMFILLLGPVVIGLYGFSQTRKKLTPSSRIPFSTKALLINSAVLYALAYNLVFFIQELFLALGKKWLGLKAFLYHNNHGWEGEHPMTDLAQGYGALAIFISAWLFLFLFLWKRNSNKWSRLFLMWMSFQGFIQSLPQVHTAIVAPQTDVAVAFAYLGIGETGLGFLTAISGVGIIGVALVFTRFLLEHAPGNFLHHPKSRFKYIFYIALLAALLGAVLIIPFRIMPWHQMAAPFILFLFSLPWIYANAWWVKNVKTVSNEVNQKIKKEPIILLIILLGIFQLLLAPGVVFQ